MISSLKIGNRLVGDNQPPYVVAELSGNHNHSLERALAIVDAAAQAGADAIKLQTYTPDTLTLNSRKPEFILPSEGSPWSGQCLWDLYKTAYTPWEWHDPIFKRARSYGLGCISTAFDNSSVDFLVSLRVDAIKIASFELINIPLLSYAATRKLPIIISTGMGTEAEIDEALSVVVDQYVSGPILLKATSAYPSQVENANLRTIPAMRERFGSLVGLSDHTLDHSVVATSVALGACVIEKHLTLDRASGGPDSSFSLEPAEFSRMTKIALNCYLALGIVSYGVQKVESTSAWERPSIWVTKDIRKGDFFTTDNLRILRPSGGLHPREYTNLMGRCAAMNISAATALQGNHISDLYKF